MREILFKAKRIDNGEWGEGCLVIDHSRSNLFEYRIQPVESGVLYAPPINPETICRFAGFCDKNGNKIWKNDILMCHGNPKDLVKVLFGEFGVRNIETGSIVDKVAGWHYEVVPTDAISRCEPFCWPMPLTEYYIERCEMEVVGNIFDNPELLQEKSVLDGEAESIPDWCPLKLLPEKDTKNHFPDEFEDGYAIGWNACIDEITGDD